MNIIYYCQHVLGIGHFFRSLEICRALSRHRVTLLTGGPRVPSVTLPDHVHRVCLPELRMDTDFSGLLAADAGQSIEAVKRRRAERLYHLVADRSPDLFIVELYPFGRRAFRFELEPVLEGIRKGTFAPCRVVCSLRDILVEKDHTEKYEARVIDQLDRYVDALLIHADPRVVRLEDTFGRTADIHIPVIYTGFVTPIPAPETRRVVRQRMNMADEDYLVTASAGGGTVGFRLLETVVHAVKRSVNRGRIRLEVLSGPYMPDNEYRILDAMADERVRVRRFDPEFPDLLAAADLAVGMAGYNTCMNILAAGIPALVRPFGQNREQRLRAGRLAEWGRFYVLEDFDLEPQRLAIRMDQALSAQGPAPVGIDLDGADTSARWLENWMRDGTYEVPERTFGR